MSAGGISEPQRCSLALFPLFAGNFIGQVLLVVGLFTLMGMGLNLEVGLAGLLDLGFVAFYAVGAYTTALLMADSPYALAQLSFWEAMPIAVLVSLIVGVIFGIPVLKIRGDYLAVATLALGEIVRVIVLSDAAAPLLAGAEGILQIPRPEIGGFVLGTPVSLFYLTLAASLVAAYVAWRLGESRLGRAWMAIRDDEDVAEALGINLIQVKLLAYGLGAAFAGLAGSIFAVMLGSIYPHSFQLIISINILALIIVGGLGSLPGVAVGAARPDRPAGDAPRVRRVPVPVLRPGDHRGHAAQARGPVAVGRQAARAGARRRDHRHAAGPGCRAEIMTGAVLLRTEQMTKRFGGLVAVDSLELAVQHGAIHSIIGPNGAGKTTVFNCIMEFYTPDDGQIWFAGQRIDGLTPDRVAAAGINRTYQTIRLFRNLTAIENILVGMHIHLKSTWYGAVLNTRATRETRPRAHDDAPPHPRLRRAQGPRRRGRAGPCLWRAAAP